MATTAPVVSQADQAATERAEAAAREAALHLHESHQRRDLVDERTVETRRLNRENHFAELIRRALGSGA